MTNYNIGSGLSGWASITSILLTNRSIKGTEENLKVMVGRSKLLVHLGDDNISKFDYGSSMHKLFGTHGGRTKQPEERELGLDRRETVIELSTRGTVHSDNWYLGLPEQAMARSYHPLGYG
ncbi:hypothetical protein BKA57DRAFT_434633 [Linnemannia elongata]|nr:hypothetical protein BKA57DRAFT_434633 [Linnemannia elongata]